MKPVGILGGMGPEATILLMQKVLAAVPAQDDADHIPLIVHQNPAVPSRIAHLIEGTGESPAPALRRMAEDLRAAGARALAMPCNTAHAYKDVLADVGLPFLDMIELTTDRLSGRIGMLASPAVQRAGVFDGAFAARGLTPVWGDEGALLQIIRDVKAGRRDAKPLARIAQAMARACDHLLVACTELSLLTDALSGLPWTDSLDCLVDGIVDFARGGSA
ncbi:aspartate/glutamate racemase family protein [Marimonas arenosa]|uniref:Amino acid racemase n=1 Tax=Marimonas arenosa TaxID=1795305 RepID=A0AAE4B647_9RHOB|nr:amino acid racemase [Marimonas arenosa]MDQ2089976.1 amino acid racemase [Marimonas arenosa]